MRLKHLPMLRTNLAATPTNAPDMASMLLVLLMTAGHPVDASARKVMEMVAGRDFTRMEEVTPSPLNRHRLAMRSVHRLASTVSSVAQITILSARSVPPRSHSYLNSAEITKATAFFLYRLLPDIQRCTKSRRPQTE